MTGFSEEMARANQRRSLEWKVVQAAKERKEAKRARDTASIASLSVKDLEAIGVRLARAEAELDGALENLEAFNG